MDDRGNVEFDFKIECYMNTKLFKNLSCCRFTVGESPAGNAVEIIVP